MIEPWKKNKNIYARFYEKNISLEDFKKTLDPSIKVISMKQVHGTEVVTITNSNINRNLEGDAMVTVLENVALTIHTADCLPLIAVADDIIGVCHAGWRGLSKNILENWIAKIGHLGAKKNALKIAVGPSIGPCHFEVGTDVAHNIVTGVPENLLSTIRLKHPNSEKNYINLRELARFKLLRLGLDPENISISTECTYCDPARYYSFRRDGDKKGQRLEAIIVKPRH